VRQLHVAGAVDAWALRVPGRSRSLRTCSRSAVHEDLGRRCPAGRDAITAGARVPARDRLQRSRPSDSSQIVHPEIERDGDLPSGVHGVDPRARSLPGCSRLSDTVRAGFPPAAATTPRDSHRSRAWAPGWMAPALPSPLLAGRLWMNRIDQLNTMVRSNLILSNRSFTLDDFVHMRAESR